MVCNCLRVSLAQEYACLPPVRTSLSQDLNVWGWVLIQYDNIQCQDHAGSGDEIKSNMYGTISYYVEIFLIIKCVKL